VPLVEAAIHPGKGSGLIQHRSQHLGADNPAEEVVDDQPLSNGMTGRGLAALTGTLD
jgi:hypothetical protein